MNDRGLHHHEYYLLLFITFIGLLQQEAEAVYGETLYWPTPNNAYLENLSMESYLQPTASGRIMSGNWGCVRNNGNRFHEGIDLKSINRSSNGIAHDKIFAIASGIVAHVNLNIQDSNYGRYIVLSHVNKGVEWCSLYAHLDSVSETLKEGNRIQAGQVIGIMGNTSSSIEIPESRAHLHFEIVLRNTSHFEKWYRSRDYDSPNKHDSWNGMNLMGVNPLEFYDYFLDHPDASFFSYFLKEPVSFEVLVHFKNTPDFLLRNPAFLRGRKLNSKASWYQIGFTWYGLPVDWIPLQGNKVDKRLLKDQFYIRSLLSERSCRNWVDESEAGFVATPLLRNHIDLLKTGD